MDDPSQNPVRKMLTGLTDAFCFKEYEKFLRSSTYLQEIMTLVPQTAFQQFLSPLVQALGIGGRRGGPAGKAALLMLALLDRAYPGTEGQPSEIRQLLQRLTVPFCEKEFVRFMKDRIGYQKEMMMFLQDHAPALDDLLTALSDAPAQLWGEQGYGLMGALTTLTLLDHAARIGDV